MIRAIIGKYIRGFSSHNICSICRSPHTMGPKPHIGVVGSGISGLRCADILVQNGARVTILEVRDRIGGRVCSYSPGAWLCCR
jgi:NADPH-dependent glutamate synthase beta subunit-like oxidoreductase